MSPWWRFQLAAGSDPAFKSRIHRILESSTIGCIPRSHYQSPVGQPRRRTSSTREAAWGCRLAGKALGSGNGVGVRSEVLSPLQIHMVVKHAVGLQSLPLETLGFLLTLLATTVTPVFVLSKRWTHLPCGCIINCRQSAYSVASDGKKSKFPAVWLL